LDDSDFNRATSSANPSALAFSPEFSAARSSSWAFKDVYQQQLALRSLIIQSIPCYQEEAKSPSKQDIREEEAVLTPHVFELRG
jgi:hypothetical protein